VRTNVGGGREAYGGSRTLRKARLTGRLDEFEGGLKSKGTHKLRWLLEVEVRS